MLTNSIDPDQTNSTDPDQTNSTDPDQTISTDPDQTNSIYPDQANSVDPDLTAPQEQSDYSLYCFPRLYIVCLVSWLAIVGFTVL